MIVDDEEIVLHFATDALSTVGHTIASTSRPEEALRLIGQEKFDFVLTDIKMPDMDGITLAQRALEIDREIGVLFMTGYADVDTAKKAIATGAYDYIMKPFELSEIRKSVATAVTKRKELQQKQGASGLQNLSELMGALNTAGDSESLLKLVLRFALYHFSLKDGLVLFYNRAAGLAQLALSQSNPPIIVAKCENVPTADFPPEFLAAGEAEYNGEIAQHPLLIQLLQRSCVEAIARPLKHCRGHFCLFSLPATEKIKLVLIVRSDTPFNVTEVDRQMLTVLLSLSSISLDNIALLQESVAAMSRLEDFKDHLIGLERAATQGMMSSEIAHELNNFIAIILSNVELFEMKAAGTYPETAVKYLENVKKNIGKFEKFTNQLSDAGKLVTRRQDSDLNEMIQEIATFARRQKRFKKVTINTNLDTAIPPLFIDQSQIQQVLYNLLNNAADAINGMNRPDGQIHITTQWDSEQREARITVVDNGCGFSEANLHKAFKDRFTTKEHGHGFGLTVIRKVIRNHGGAIDVNSSEGQGATITLTIAQTDAGSHAPIDSKAEPARA